MTGESPILALGLVVGLPLLLRYAPLLRSLSKPRLRRELRSPAEAFVFLLVVALSTYHLWTLSPFSTSHRRAKDIFRRTGLPIGSPAASLRSRVATLSYEDLGLQALSVAEGEGDGNEGDVIDRLLQRLGSMSGRQAYLLLGPSALLECHYCKQSKDLTLFALANLLAEYALHLFAFGFMTVSPVTLDAIDGSLSFASAPASPASMAAQKRRAHSQAWRRPASILVLMLITCETGVVFDFFGWGDRQTSWWNHWHHNVFLLRHLLLLATTLLIYLYPSSPSPVASSSLQIATSLGTARELLTRATSNVALAQAGRDAIWQDPLLRRTVTDYYSSQDDDRSADELLVAAAQRGVLKPGARNQASLLVLTKVQKTAEKRSQEGDDRRMNSDKHYGAG